MADASTDVKPEIVIIRRRAPDDGAAVKGGAWKIAYADFVTAMMAFFLVMWLINASNEATRSQVASYFNPIKLTDTSTGDKGMTDPKDATKKTAGKSSEPAEVKQQAAEHEAEEKLLADPAAALEKIMMQAGAEPAKSKSAELKSAEAGGSSEESSPRDHEGVGDPFDPMSWENVPEAKPQPGVSGEAASPGETAPPQSTEMPQPEAGPATPAAAKEDARLTPEAETEDTTQAPEATTGPSPETLNALRQKVLQSLGSKATELSGRLDIQPVPDGTLISLTDSAAIGMFRSGSAEPDADTIALIAAIADAVRTEPGYIVVRGHTDSSPYRSRKYDNWQLSTARAHMTQYMLVRGGLDESRIRRVEGVADREPRVADDPGAPENRRIEILLGLAP